jgi:dTDP-4-dehydrorhamnose 3,5-epimerase
MTLDKLSISGAYLSTHKVFPDERGVFREWFRSEEILTIDAQFSVQQANYSNSKQWVIRGIHYSMAPEGQAKIVTCASGAIVDVLIDLRVGSPTYLKIEHIELSEESGKVIYIPSGVGHGFIVTSNFASVVYLTSSRYAPEYEKAISPTDPGLAITWPLPTGVIAIISKSDLKAPSFSRASELGDLPIF